MFLLAALRGGRKKTAFLTPLRRRFACDATALGFYDHSFLLVVTPSIRNIAGGELEPAEADFAPAQALLRSIPWVMVAIVVLFYEAAFIIGGAESRLTKPLRG